VVEFLPFLLILIGWQPSAPGESMTITHSLHASEEACRERGEALLVDGPGVAGLPEAAHYRYFCIPAPTAEEYDEAFEQLK